MAAIAGASIRPQTLKKRIAHINGTARADGAQDSAAISTHNGIGKCAVAAEGY